MSGDAMTKPTVTVATLRRIEAWVAEWQQLTPMEKKWRAAVARGDADDPDVDAERQFNGISMLSTPKSVL